MLILQPELNYPLHTLILSHVVFITLTKFSDPQFYIQLRTCSYLSFPMLLGSMLSLGPMVLRGLITLSYHLMMVFNFNFVMIHFWTTKTTKVGWKVSSEFILVRIIALLNMSLSLFLWTLKENRVISKILGNLCLRILMVILKYILSTRLL